MYSGNETVNAIRKLNSRGYAVMVEEVNNGQVVSLISKGKLIGVYKDDVFGNSSNAIPVYGTAMKNMIDWLYSEDNNNAG